MKNLLIQTYNRFIKFSKFLDEKRNDKRFLLLVCIFFGIVYLLLFFTIRHGIGQFWDWTFPYYKDQISNIFDRSSLSWNSAQFGSPLIYNSDYFLNFLISNIKFMQPETLRYFLMVITFMIGSFGVFLITKKKTGILLAFILGLAAFINPTIFYKVTAGHFDYYVSYTIFIYLIYFVINKFKSNVFSAVILGLLLGFVGFQIQFFFFAFLFILLYLILYRDRAKIIYSVFAGIMALLINSVWLSNFIFGARNINEVGAAAARVSFKATSRTDLTNIINFTFSKATLISRFYSSLELVVYTLLFTLAIFSFFIFKNKKSSDYILPIYTIIMCFLATGFFIGLNLGPLNTFFPMFREVGHFAPIIVLCIMLMLGMYIKGGANTLICTILILISIFVSWGKFDRYLQTINFQDMRNKFSEFKKFGDNNNDKSAQYRILAYPFFSPFSIKGYDNKIENNLPLKNSGHDSFSAYSNENFVYNAIAPQDLKKSVQYQLLSNYNTDPLKRYNVKFIYDYSHVYKSNYSYYAPSSVYNKNIRDANNDTSILDKIVEANKGKVKRISDHVVEILNFEPKFTTSNSPIVLGLGSNIDNSSTNFLSNIGYKTPTFINDINNNKDNNLSKLSHLKDLFNNKSDIEVSNGSTYSTDQYDLGYSTSAKIFKNFSNKSIFYKANSRNISVYSKPPNDPIINDQVVAFDNAAYDQIIATSSIISPNMFIVLDNLLYPISDNIEYDLGLAKNYKEGGIYNATENKIKNPSFESGLWQPKVNDCNKYDDNGNISMSVDKSEASDGKQSLRLDAIKHIACTNIDFDVDAGQKSVLQFNYKSPNSKVTGYYIAFNDPRKTIIKDQIDIRSSADWQTFSKMLDVPLGANHATLYLYAYESNGIDSNTVKFDDVLFGKLNLSSNIAIPHEAANYVEMPINLKNYNNIKYKLDNIHKINFAKNPSFESGLWQPKVNDCNKYDDNGNISMSVDKSEASDGKQSLQLDAIRHAACTRTTIDFDDSMSTGVLEFDYQSNNSIKAGYNLEYNDPTHTTINENLSINSSEWQRFTKYITIPKGASSAVLTLYAYESDGVNKNVVRYDNIQLYKTADLTDTFYILTDQLMGMENPKQVNFGIINTSEQIVIVKGASKQFLLNFAESYNSGWKVYLNPISQKSNKYCEDNKIFESKEEFITNKILECNAKSNFNSGLSNKNILFDKDHFKINDYANSWIIDPLTIKSSVSHDYYSDNPDGSIDFSITVYFKPQIYFYFSRLLSVVIIISSVTYLVYIFVKNRTSIKGRNFARVSYSSETKTRDVTTRSMTRKDRIKSLSYSNKDHQNVLQKKMIKKVYDVHGTNQSRPKKIDT